MPYTVLDPAVAKAAPSTTIGAPLTSVGETLDSLSTELNVLLGARQDIDPARITRWINQAYKDLVTSLDLPELNASIALPLDADQPLYMLPDCVDYVLGASMLDTTVFPDLGGRTLIPKSLNWYRQQVDYTMYAKYYFEYNGMLVVYPTPKAATELSVEFAVLPLDLVTATDSPILKTYWHEAILLSARVKGFRGLLEFDLALAAENDYVNWIRRRSDPKSQQDENRVPLSSVPRHSRQLFGRRGWFGSRRNEDCF